MFVRPRSAIVPRIEMNPVTTDHRLEMLGAADSEGMHFSVTYPDHTRGRWRED